MAMHNANGIESVKEVSPTPPAPKYLFGNQAPDIFHVELDKEYQALNDSGKVISGKVCRWANVSEGNEYREEFLKREYYSRCTDPRVKTPFATNARKDGTCGGEVPIIKRYGETYMLMEREAEAADEQYKQERAASVAKLKAANTTAGADGIKPEWTLTPDRKTRRGR